MKICFLANHQCTLALNWANSLSEKRNYKIYFITDSYVRADDKKFSIKYINLGEFKYGKILYQSYKLNKIVRHIKPDIIHAFYTTNFGLLSILTNTNNHVVTVQGSDIFIEPNKSKIFYYINKIVFKKAQKVHSMANHMTEEIKRYGVNKNKIITFPEGVNIQVFKNIQKYRNRTIKMISTRRLKRFYQNDVLLKAASTLKSKNLIIKLTIIGEGPEKENLKKLAKELQIQKEVQFIGYVSRQKYCKYLNENYYYISTSPSDGASASLFEAMASGIFPIVSNIAANKEIIKDHENGLLFEENNPLDLAKCLIDIHKNKKLYDKAIRKNIDLINNVYCKDLIISQLKEEYEKIYNNARAYSFPM